MANDEFVDLDDIVPGTGFRKKQDDFPQKKEPVKTAQTPQEAPSQKPLPESTPAPKQDAQKIIDSSEIEEESIDFKDEPEAKSPREKPAKQEKSQKTEKVQKPLEKEDKMQKQEKQERTEKAYEKNAKPSAPQKKQQVKAEENSQKEKPKQKLQKPAEQKPAEQKQAPKPELKPQQKEDVKKSILKRTILQPKRHSVPAKSSKPIRKEDAKAELKKESLSRKSRKFQRKSDGKETNWAIVALLALGVVIIAVIAYMIFKFDFPGSKHDSVVAVVNSKPIYRSEITERLDLLKTTLNPDITEEQVLNLTITDELLLQEADKRGIRTSDEEVDSLLADVMSQNGIDEQTLKDDLASKNVSFDYLRKIYKNTLTINKLINESFGSLNVSEEEISQYYEANKDSFAVPDMVSVRHILFKYGPETENETYKQATDVLALVKPDKSNFCGLVSTYTEDDGSKDICGEYNFSADYPYVPEFISAGFAMIPGDIKIVKSQIGYQIVYKITNIPAHIQPLSDVHDSIIPVIREQKGLVGLQNLIAQLQNDAIIEIYNENITTKRFTEVTADSNPAPEKTETTAPAVEESAAAQQEEVPPENTQVVISKEVVPTPTSQKYLLAACLSDGGSRMFTASWSPDSKSQLALFDDFAKNLDVVECDPETPGAQVEECANVLKKQYPTWPTWQINGVLYEGIQSLNALSRYSNCPY